MAEQAHRAEQEVDDKNAGTEDRYEKPRIIYRGKLETYAIICNKTTVGCGGGTQSAS